MGTINKDKDVDYIRKGMAVFVRNYDGNYNKATTDEVTAAINQRFKDYEADGSINSRLFADYDKEGPRDEAYLEAFFVNNVVQATFWSYFTSQLVGETVMRYDPIPGKYEDITYKPGERAWASV